LDLRRLKNIVAKMAGEISLGAQVDGTPAQHGGKFGFHCRERQKAWRLPGLKFDKQVQIAVRPVGPFNAEPNSANFRI
jgi:hypothetical protein